MYAPYPRSVGTGGFFDDVAHAASSVGKGISKAASGAARGIAKTVNSATKSAAHAASDAVKAVESVPIVGDAIRFAGNAAAAPINLASAIASGARIDHAIEGELKRQLKNVKDIAPYAQTVLSLVPGIGTGVAAAAAAGIALAEGRDIDDIAKAAIRNSIPGGPAAAAAFDGAVKVASGANVAKAALESARSAVPEGLRSAYDVGVAVATGQKIQNALASGLANMAGAQAQEILAAGAKAIAATPALSSAIQGVASGAPQDGFKKAAGLLKMAGVNEKAVRAVREKLAPAERAGFDAALRTQVGELAWLSNVVHTPPRLTGPPKRTPPKLNAVKRAPPKLSAIKPAASRQVIATQASKAMQEATGPATGTVQPIAPPSPGAPIPGAAPTSASGGSYGPYPQAGTVAGLGAFWSDDKWRWFAVYDGARLVASRGPMKMSDHDALKEEAGFLESTLGRGYVGSVHRWDWDGSSWRQTRGGALGLAGCGGPPCSSFGAPIADMDPGMHRAGLSAVNSNRGRPRMVSAPNGTDYQFALEGGRLVARECLR